jgi:Helix-turn-helix domain
MIDRGELPAVRVGKRRVRIRRSELDRFIAAGETVKREPIDLAAVDRRGSAAWATFGAAMIDATAIIERADADELMRVLERLAAATQALADELRASRKASE